MKLKFSVFLLLALLTISATYVSADDNEEVEIIDDEAEVEVEDDDASVDIEDEAPTPESDQEAEPVKEEEKGQMMPQPLQDVLFFIFFPEGAHSLTGGKLSEVVFGVQNNGDVDVQVVSARGRLMMPGQQEPVQNLTQVGYEKQLVQSKSEASFSYGIFPHLQTGGREFDILVEVIYKQADNNNYYTVRPFSETINILESTEGVATEIAFLWLTVVVLALVGAYVLYQRFLARMVHRANLTKKVETGTSSEVSEQWIPSSHANLKKRTVAKN